MSTANFCILCVQISKMFQLLVCKTIRQLHQLILFFCFCLPDFVLQLKVVVMVVVGFWEGYWWSINWQKINKLEER